MHVHFLVFTVQYEVYSKNIYSIGHLNVLPRDNPREMVLHALCDLSEDGCLRKMLYIS